MEKGLYSLKYVISFFIFFIFNPFLRETIRNSNAYMYVDGSVTSYNTTFKTLY